MAADGETLDGGDPRLFERLAAHIVGRNLRVGETAINLVHVAEIALDIPEKRNPPPIEMGQIDAGAEDAAVPVSRMLNPSAAQHDDAGRTIEQREVDAGRHGGQRRLILRVQVARIAHRDDAGLAVSCDRRASEVDDAVAGERGHELDGLAERQQHGMAEMAAVSLGGEHGGEEQALVDLHPVLVAQREPAFRLHLLRARHEPGRRKRRCGDELMDPQEARSSVGQAVIEFSGVGGEKRRSRLPRLQADQLGRRAFGRVAPRFVRKPRKQPGRAIPEFREGGSILGERRTDVRPRARPRRDVVRIEARGAQGLGREIANCRLPHEGASTVDSQRYKQQSSGDGASRQRHRTDAWTSRSVFSARDSALSERDFDTPFLCGAPDAPDERRDSDRPSGCSIDSR